MLAITLERKLAIYKPLGDKLSTKMIFINSTATFVFSFLLTLKQGLSYRIYTNMSYYIDGVIYEYSSCRYVFNNEEHLINTIITNTMGIWLPMVLISIMYTHM